MKLWMKVLIVVACGGTVWGLSFCGSLFPSYGLVCSSFSAGITALCGILTGFPPSSTEA